MSSKIIFSMVLVLASLLFISSAKASPLVWSHTYGGSGQEVAYAMIETVDGGYALAGYTDSFGMGQADFWLVKTDANGNMEWNQTYGGALTEIAYSLIQTPDGGYAMAGFSSSFTLDGNDFWLVKTDSKGNTEWNQTYGGVDSEAAKSVVMTPDGGYALLGYTFSFGAGADDFFLVKTDPMGNIEWNKTYGEQYYDSGFSLIVTSDGGLALTGSKDARINYSNSNFWLIKTDPQGNVEWDRKYSNWVDHPKTVINTSDAGYLLAGSAGFFTPMAGWLVKTDENGFLDWDKEYGSLRDEHQEEVNNAIETTDTGFMLAAQTDATGGKGFDIWIIKTDENGEVMWNQTYGGPQTETPCTIIQAPDDGYMVAGTTNSYGAGKTDFWLIKIDPQSIIPEFPTRTIAALTLITTTLITIYKNKLQQTKTPQT